MDEYAIKGVRRTLVVLWAALVFLVSYQVGTNLHANVGRDFGYAYVGQTNSTGVYVGKVNSGILVAGYGCEVWVDHLSVDCFRQGS